MAIHVGRDVFARGEYHKTKIVMSFQSCNWCGTRKGELYKYTWEEDDKFCPPRMLSDKKFCNFDCFKSYFSLGRK